MGREARAKGTYEERRAKAIEKQNQLHQQQMAEREANHVSLPPGRLGQMIVYTMSVAAIFSRK